LSGRKYQVRIDSLIRDLFEILLGVLQGSVLGPIPLLRIYHLRLFSNNGMFGNPDKIQVIFLSLADNNTSINIG